MTQVQFSKYGVATKMAWAKNGTALTLGSELDDMDITDLTANTFNQFMVHIISGASSTCTPNITFDNTGGNDYTRRNSTNGGADSTVLSAALVQNGLGGLATGTDSFTVDYVVNMTSEEKLGIYFNIAIPAGAGTAPSRSEGVFKKDTTTDTSQFTRIDINNPDAGGFATSSNISALGSDLTPAAAIPFPSDVQENSRAEITDTRKIYYITPEYKVHSFTSTGNTTFAVTGSGDIEYLVVAGGGSGGGKDGGSNHVGGGGAGAGGFRTNVSGATSGGGASAEATYGVTAQAYTITVGAGGAGVSVNIGGIDGGDSSIVPTSGTSIISTGGGGGYETQAGVSNGGSGSGGGLAAGTGGLGTSGQGYDGGDGTQSANYGTGGGGGSGSLGGDGTTTVGGVGGDGTASSIQTGTSITYAGGGGGGMYSPSNSAGALGGAGGSGGGGAGGNGNASNGIDATGYGSGGGGAGGSNSVVSPVSGAGSDGIVIIRYVNDGSITATGGTITTIDSVWEELGT